MKPIAPTPKFDDAELAAHVAVGAGEILLGARHRQLLGGRRLGDVGDALSQAWIAAVLRVHRPQDAVLSEEAPDSNVRLSARRVWIIDPLDGTKHYAAHRNDWAVHVALAVDGVAGPSAVALPATGEVFRSDTVTPPTGALSGRVATSRWGVPYETAYIANKLELQPLHMGSAGAKAMAVVRGDADLYLHSGGQYEWDNCAPIGVAAAAGLHCSRIDGSPVRYNNADPFMPDFVICRGEIADEVMAHLRGMW